MENTQIEKLNIVAQLRPIDDKFFEVLAGDTKVCEEILRTIIEDPGLIVTDVIVQSDERNLYGRSVRLDALCTLGDGRKCNIEVQRADNDDHLRRVRFNASSITVRESSTNDHFSDVKDVIVVYISEFDMFRAGYTTYHVEKRIKETNEVIDDGLTEIFVNTVVKDGTKTSRLMSNFLKTDVNDPEFPAFSERMHLLKHEQEGVNAMCKIIDDYVREQNSKLQHEVNELAASNNELISRNNELTDIINRIAKTDQGKALLPEDLVKQLESNSNTISDTMK